MTAASKIGLCKIIILKICYLNHTILRIFCKFLYAIGESKLFQLMINFIENVSVSFSESPTSLRPNIWIEFVQWLPFLKLWKILLIGTWPKNYINHPLALHYILLVFNAYAQSYACKYFYKILLYKQDVGWSGVWMEVFGGSEPPPHPMTSVKIQQRISEISMIKV